MEAGELARQRTSALHDAGVLRGDDPTRPYLFAKAQAGHCDIDVEACQRGASILDGGRAKLIAARSMILHEDSGSEFDQAFLVAHELGHAVLGDGTGHVVSEGMDPARPAEPSPVGVDRVVDYGRRQRREIQMDLFARELLLPRSLVRRLHVDENMSATAIAQRFQAPFNVVAQQLLDALLLPAVEAKAEETKPPTALNKLQGDAAKHRGGPYLLEAGPGTGKTRTLTASDSRAAGGWRGPAAGPRAHLLE
jgi:Zn-dependent peptidase ImmA (M78 family)